VSQVESFYLAADPGRLYCVYHPPRHGAPRVAVAYCPPFLEEMNKARRMAALQARRFAAAGAAVLLVDLYGCGDSEGELATADWGIWKQNIAAACGWLRGQTGQPVTLWGLRAGCLLALDAAREPGVAAAGYVLWQPVLNGESAITQFLRLRVAAGMLSDTGAATGTSALRQALKSGETLEVAGYDLNPRLAAGMDALKLTDLCPSAGVVSWLEIAADPARPPSPATQRSLDAFRAAGAEVRFQTVEGEAFWSTLEITECPRLIEATGALFERLSG
jgi:exosortase A-associated hydrolase 2